MNKKKMYRIKSMRSILFFAALLCMPLNSSNIEETLEDVSATTEVATTVLYFDDEDGVDLFSQEELLVQQELVYEFEQNRPWFDKLLEKLQMIAGRLTSPLFYWWYKLLIKKEL